VGAYLACCARQQRSTRSTSQCRCSPATRALHQVRPVIALAHRLRAVTDINPPCPCPCFHLLAPWGGRSSSPPPWHGLQALAHVSRTLPHCLALRWNSVEHAAKRRVQGLTRLGPGYSPPRSQRPARPVPIAQTTRPRRGLAASRLPAALRCPPVPPAACNNARLASHALPQGEAPLPLHHPRRSSCSSETREVPALPSDVRYRLCERPPLLVHGAEGCAGGVGDRGPCEKLPAKG